jgi:hypothetical protein
MDSSDLKQICERFKFFDFGESRNSNVEMRKTTYICQNKQVYELIGNKADQTMKLVAAFDKNCVFEWERTIVAFNCCSYNELKLRCFVSFHR